MVSLTDLESRASASVSDVTNVEVDGFSFAVSRLPAMVFDAARLVADARAQRSIVPPAVLADASGDAAPVMIDVAPSGLDLKNPQHVNVWRTSLMLEEIAAASVVGWTGIEDDVTPDAVRRMVRLTPDAFGLAIYAAAKPAEFWKVGEDGEPGNG